MVMLAAAALCLLYYLLISAAMRKWNSTFAGFWPGAGAVCLAGHMAVTWGPRRLALAVWCLFLIALFVFAAVELLILTGMREEGGDDCPVILVLGAQIRGRAVTVSLRRRLDRAAAWLERHPGGRVIVSGGRGKGEEITEAAAMAAYLEERGIDRERILLEDASTTTWENLLFSKRYIEDTDGPVGIVTNNFHMYRAKAYARRAGYRDPRGLPAPCGRVLFLNYMTREFFAVWKMWIARKQVSGR